jgi:uncharacterized membrane protein YhhN
MKRSPFLILFWFVAVAHIAATGIAWRALEVFTKPLILPMLLAYYLSNARVRSIGIILALVFSWLGDGLLLVQPAEEIFFMLGLGSFLLAHGFYIFSYRQHCFDTARAGGMGTQKVRLAFPVTLAGMGLVVVLFPSLGAMKIPVVIYALILTAMVVSAIFRLGLTSTTSFWMVVSGAVLFMASDSLLAINKFLELLPNASVWIMITYCAAQFLIVEGILRHPPEA